MKRILSAFLILAAAFFLVACIDNKVELTDVSATTGENNGEIRVSAKIKDDEDGKINYIVVEKSGAAPTVDEVISGSNYGSVTVSAKGNAEKTLDKTVTGLTGGTEYSVYFVASNDDTKSGVVKKDVTAKEVTTTVEAPTVTATAVTSVAISGGIDITASTTAGTIYYVVTASSAVKPSAEEVVAGNEYAGNAVVAKGNGATIDTTVSGLDEGTTYAIYFAAKNDTVHSEVVKKEATAKVDTDERGVQATVDCSTNGEGTEESPFVVCSVEDMENIGDNKTEGVEDSGYLRNEEYLDYSMSKYYIVGQDIDFGTKYNEDATDDWTTTPLGSGSAFKGTFDGNGYTLKNLYINTTNSIGRAGLFSQVGESGGKGVLKNIVVESFSVEVTQDSESTTEGAGALVGRFRGTEISNIRGIGNEVVVNANSRESSYGGDSRAGTLIGRVTNVKGSDIRISYISVDETSSVIGFRRVGGVIGHIDYGTKGDGGTEGDSASDYGIYVSNVVSYATVKGTDTVGGVIGYTQAHVSNLVSYANVEADNTHGGSASAGAVLGSLSNSSKPRYIKDHTPSAKNLINAGATVKALEGQNVIGTVSSSNSDGSIALEQNYPVPADRVEGLYALDSLSVDLTDGNTLSVGDSATDRNGLAVTADDIKNTEHAMYENFNFNSFWEMENNVPTLKDIFKSYVA